MSLEIPRHLAIIMDGNGRWAQARGRNRSFGHLRGTQTAKEIIKECVKLNVEYLTLYAFSAENWFRPEEEVSFLMQLLRRYLEKEKDNLISENIRLNCIGDISKLPETTRNIVEDTIEVTKNNSGLNLIFALNYGGRQEILSAVKSLVQEVKSHKLDIEDLDEQVFSSLLDTKNIPDPDLVIRTSGECRVSNFLLWQIAYSEFVFSKKLWPDFSKEDLHQAFTCLGGRQRRFGRTGGQVLNISDRDITI